MTSKTIVECTHVKTLLNALFCAVLHVVLYHCFQGSARELPFGFTFYRDCEYTVYDGVLCLEKEYDQYIMAETIWNGVVTAFEFVMDNLVVINVLFALVIVFFQRRSPQTVWTWLLLLYFIPILGFVMYLIIGQDYHKSRMFKAKEIEGELKYAVRRQEETIYHRKLLMANPAMNGSRI